MRILIVSHYLPPNPGGIEHVVDNLAYAYVARGATVVMAGMRRSSDGAERPYRRVALAGLNSLERFGVPVPLLEPVTAVLRLRKLVNSVDAVHVHGLPYPASVITLCCARLVGIPVVVTEHVGTVNFSNPVLAAVQRFAMGCGVMAARHGAVAVAVLNDRVRGELNRRVAPVPVIKVPNGIDSGRFYACSPEERQELRDQWNFSRPTVLFVGRNVPKKGLDLLVRAVPPDACYDLVLVGAGTKTIASGHPHVRALGPLDHESVASLYRAADILALPSTGEGLPLVVQEALASGLPVLLGDDPALRHELPSGPVRFVERTSEAIAVVLDELMNDANLLPQMREDAMLYHTQQLSWASTADRYLTILSGSGTELPCQSPVREK